MLQEAVRSRDVPAYAAGASGARRIAARASRAIDVVDISRDLGLSLIYVPSMRNGHSADFEATDRGSAILATLPLGDPIAVELPGERQRRVAIFASLLIPSEGASPVSVANIHLDALGAPRRLWIFGTSSVRHLQVKAIAPLMPETNLVLGADLNTWNGPREAAPRFLETVFGTRVAIVRDRPAGRVLDYLFFRLAGNLAAQCTVAANDYGSDHHPLIGRIVRAQP
jgi:endonuclease/exonuclease/phosphatase family metal-dependent hydrolase